MIPTKIPETRRVRRKSDAQSGSRKRRPKTRWRKRKSGVRAENICAILRKRNPKRLFARQRAKENASGISCRPRGRIVRVPTKKKNNKTRTHCDGYRTGDQALIGRAGRKRVGFSREHRGVKGGALEDARASVGSSACALHERTRERAREDREREKNKIKKEKTKKKEERREYTRVHARLFSARVHSSYETSLELVSYKLSRKLVSEIRHFSHPRWLPRSRCSSLFSSLFLLFFSLSLSLHHAPPALLYAASIVVPPFSTRNLLLTKGRSDGRGKIEPPANRECSPFRSSRGSARITPQLPRFTLPSFLPSFLSLSLFRPLFLPFHHSLFHPSALFLHFFRYDIAKNIRTAAENAR